MTWTTTLLGGCHCRDLRVELASQLDAAALPVRTCGCTFCALHSPSYTSDPAGSLTVRAASAGALVRYRFGLRLADFLICARCGVFVAAVEKGPPTLGVLNARVLDEYAQLTSTPSRFEAYDSEDVATRQARRAQRWTPCSLVVG